MITCESLLLAEALIPRLLDVAGRPVAEGRADDDVKCLAPMEYKGCPYPGSRAGQTRPMNLSALRSVMDNWAGVLDIVGETRRRYLETVGRTTPTIRDLLRIVELASALPVYVHAKGSSRVPDAAAATFKVLLGPKDVLNGFTFSKAHRKLPVLDYTLDADAFFEHVEANGFLIGGVEVCAGPPSAIREILTLLCDGDRRRRGSFFRAHRIDFPELTAVAARAYDLKVALFFVGVRALALLVHLQDALARHPRRVELRSVLAAEITAVLAHRKLNVAVDGLDGLDRDNRFCATRRDVLWAPPPLKRSLRRSFEQVAAQRLHLPSCRAFAARWAALERPYRAIVQRLDGARPSQTGSLLARHLRLDLGRIHALLGDG